MNEKNEKSGFKRCDAEISFQKWWSRSCSFLKINHFLQILLTVLILTIKRCWGAQRSGIPAQFPRNIATFFFYFRLYLQRVTNTQLLYFFFFTFTFSFQPRWRKSRSECARRPVPSSACNAGIILHACGSCYSRVNQCDWNSGNGAAGRRGITAVWRGPILAPDVHT